MRDQQHRDRGFTLVEVVVAIVLVGVLSAVVSCRPWWPSVSAA